MKSINKSQFQVVDDDDYLSNCYDITSITGPITMSVLQINPTTGKAQWIQL